MKNHYLYQRIFSLLLGFIYITSSSGQIKIQPKDNTGETIKTFNGQLPLNVSSPEKSFNTNSSIRIIFQDKSGVYWFGTAREGVYRYDPSASANDQSTDMPSRKSLIQYTYKDGLCNNEIRTIQEDKSGNIWFNTGDGVCRFDGRKFMRFPNNETLQSKDVANKEWKKDPGDLWFETGGGVYRYHESVTPNGQADENSFTYLPLPNTKLKINYAQSPSSPISPFTIYTTFKDRSGNLWFGTQSLGVSRFDGISFSWFTDKGLSGPAVLAIFEDKAGNLWFGNNGAGLFRYETRMPARMNKDGNDTTGQPGLTNFTKENGLSNDEFWTNSKISGKPGPGTLARIYSINEDKDGDLWIGTIDAGVWRYNPHRKTNELTNYTIKDGLPSNVINTIYKDNKGELWFGTEAGLCKFNGITFSRFTIK